MAVYLIRRVCELQPGDIFSFSEYAARMKVRVIKNGTCFYMPFTHRGKGDDIGANSQKLIYVWSD